ncbi:MAG TPA: 16S rRNA (cytidine(1402)-2'-O)-methyltransferase [Pyrinomonadaceae bacterium]|jgi:16S rRNA (cytidine1402-2'-O)-methyltransferase|nr:16S rRNA (cytidine(1402)-2'-O)-methyltransferase [Pyrinomonadaceae bacterium]
MAGTLYLVATPIGNLEDITQRALHALAAVEVIACEDTRRTRILLDHYGIKAKLTSYHEHNERERARELSALLVEGSDVALVSDAGTPGISDPGFRLVQEAIARGARVVPLPGPTALISALIASGLPTDQFFFGGFLPARSTQRRARLQEVRAIPATLIFYETPHRIHAALLDAREILGEREAVVVRELTKIHEEILRGRLSELAQHFDAPDTARGEMVLLIDRHQVSEELSGMAATVDVAARVAALEAEGLGARDALKRAARELGLSRSEAYRRLTADRARLKQT